MHIHIYTNSIRYLMHIITPFEFQHKLYPTGVFTEGQLPRGAQYLGEKVTVEGDKQHTDTFYTVPTEETTTTTRTVEHKPVVYEGIGPVDKEGVPLAFRKVGCPGVC